MPKISLTGDLGSGKSTVAKLLVERLGASYVSTGNIQRALAAELGLTTLEMNHRSETDPTVDQTIDGRLQEMGQALTNAIFDSRLGWHFIPDSFKIYLTCNPEVAAKRIFKDVSRTSEAYQDESQALLALQARKMSENNRFLEKYGVDCADMKNFDLVIDTSERTPEQVVEEILKHVQV
jgi:cytidylate kinase